MSRGAGRRLELIERPFPLKSTHPHREWDINCLALSAVKHVTPAAVTVGSKYMGAT